MVGDGLLHRWFNWKEMVGVANWQVFLTFVYGNIHILTLTGCGGDGVVMVAVREIRGGKWWE